MDSPQWQIQMGDGPLVAAAIHDGHDMRPSLRRRLAISDEDRRREEDPYTGRWTSVAPTRVVGMRSRFEVDLNRPRDKAVYLSPDDCWGLNVWKSALPSPEIQTSLETYDRFYDQMYQLLTQLVLRHGRVIVFDLHSYNHRRLGPDDPGADPAGAPEVNVGTGTLDRTRWAPIIDRCIGELRAFNYHGRQLDVRENVKFFGGQFPRWIHQNFPDAVCAISIEFKKFFMDEWTGIPDKKQLNAIGQALHAAAAGLAEELVRGETVEPSF